MLTSLSVSYYFVIFLPSQEKIKIEKAEQKESERKTKEDQRQLDLDQCLLNAEIDYIDHWNKNCKGRRLKNDCSLPLNLADSINKILKENKEDCFKKYPKTD
jgi:hypothetical protein